MFYDDPTRKKSEKMPDDDTTGQKGGQTGAEDSLGDLDEGRDMEDITSEDQIKDIDEETS